MAGEKVLVVEDEQIIAMDLSRRLEALGYTVTGMAGNAETALRKARSLRPDIVLMDIVLPGGADGVELSALMRSELEVPIVFVTAHSDDRTVERAKATGPYGYVTKPVDDRQLQIVIDMAVYKHAAEKALRDSEERFRQLAEASSEGMLVHDRGIVLDLNTCMARLLGCVPEQITGKSLSGLVDGPVEGPDALAVFQRDGPSEVSMRRADGTTFPAEVAGRSMPFRGRTVRVSAVRDITQRRRMERLIKERARSELYGFVVSALPLIAPGALQTVREDMLRIFGDRFERFFRPKFSAEANAAQGAGSAGAMDAYLRWAAELFSNFGIDAAHSSGDGAGVLEFRSCPWIEYSRKNPVFCVLCQTMVSRSFSWASPGGAVGIRGTIAGGGELCRMELEPAGRARRGKGKQ